MLIQFERQNKLIKQNIRFPTIPLYIELFRQCKYVGRYTKQKTLHEVVQRF